MLLLAQPDAVWEGIYGDRDADIVTDVCQMSDGNITVCGSSTFNGWLFIIDGDGNSDSSFYFEGEASDRFMSVTELTDNNLILSGYTASRGLGGYDSWLVKVDANREMVWQRTYGGRAEDRTIRHIETEARGFALAGLTFSSGAGNSDGWFVITDEDGYEEFAGTYGGNREDVFTAVVQTEGGDFILAGTTSSSGAGEHDFWLIKIDNEGNEVWSNTYGFEGDEWAEDAVLTSDDGVLMIGRTASTGEGDQDIWIVKTNADGEMEWSRSYGGRFFDTGKTITRCNDGGYLLGCNSESFGRGSTDFYIIRIEENGDFIWSGTYGGNGYEGCNSIIEIGGGGCLLAGNTTTFGRGNWDGWLVRLEPESFGFIHGFIRDYSTNEVLGNARIITSLDEARSTDEQGYWHLDHALTGDFSLTATRVGYSDSTLSDLHINQGDSLVLNFELLHPISIFSLDSITVELIPDQSWEEYITIENLGNGLFEWMVEYTTDWITVYPLQGTIPPRYDLEVFITFSSDGLETGEYSDTLKFLHNSGNGETIIPVDMIIGENGISMKDRSQPESVNILSIEPNPFNSVARIRYTLTSTSEVKLSLFDVAGREFISEETGIQSAGIHEIFLHAGIFPAGIYIIRLEADDEFITRKMVLVR